MSASIRSKNHGKCLSSKAIIAKAMCKEIYEHFIFKQGNELQLKKMWVDYHYQRFQETMRSCTNLPPEAEIPKHVQAVGFQ